MISPRSSWSTASGAPGRVRCLACQLLAALDIEGGYRARLAERDRPVACAIYWSAVVLYRAASQAFAMPDQSRHLVSLSEAPAVLVGSNGAAAI